MKLEIGGIYMTGNNQKVIQIKHEDARFYYFETLYLHTGTPSEFKLDKEGVAIGYLRHLRDVCAELRRG